MLIFDYSDFNGFVVPPDQHVAGGCDVLGDFIGFAIGPESTVDRLKVNGVQLGLGAVLPMRVSTKARLEPTRGRPGGPFAARGGDINGRLQLLCYECGDQLLLPGPRAPYVAGDIRDLSNAYVRVLRVPFAGRRYGRLTFWTENTTDQPVEWIAEGVIYHPRGIDESVTVTGETPGRVQLDAQTMTPVALTSDGGTRQRAYYLGGTDSAEALDEVWIWARLTAEAAQNVVTNFEAHDTPVR